MDPVPAGNEEGILAFPPQSASPAPTSPPEPLLPPVDQSPAATSPFPSQASPGPKLDPVVPNLFLGMVEVVVPGAENGYFAPGAVVCIEQLREDEAEELGLEHWGKLAMLTIVHLVGGNGIICLHSPTELVEANLLATFLLSQVSPTQLPYRLPLTQARVNAVIAQLQAEDLSDQ